MMFKALNKIFTCLVLSFCLLHSQIAPVYAQASTNTDSQQAREEFQEMQESAESSDSESGDESSNGSSGDGMLSKTFSVSTDDTNIGFSDMLVFILLIGIAAFILSVWKYQPMSMDMRIAMSAGVVMVVSVLMSIFNTRGDIDAGTYRVEKKEDGTVNNMQLDALKEQRQSYADLRDHAELKWKVEAAATAAFTIAAVFAWTASASLEGKSATCMSALTVNQCPVALSLHKTEMAARWAPAPSDEKLRQRSENVKARQEAIQQCKGVVDPPTPQTIAAGIAAADAACLPEVSQLRWEEPFTVVTTNEEGDETESEIDLQGDGMDSIYEGSSLFLPSLFKNPFNSNDSNLVRISFLNEFLGQENHFLGVGSIPSAVESNYRERIVFEANDSNFDKVLGFFLPKAYSFDFNMKLFGLTGAALLLLKQVRKFLERQMDKWMGNPAHRRNIYLGAAAISGAAAYLSKQSLGEAEDNIEKLDKMINKIENLQDMSKTQQRLQQQDIGLAQGLKPTERPDPVNISPGEDPLSCNRPLKNGKCASLESEIRKDRSFSSLDPRLGNIAGLAGRTADGIVGSSSLDSGTVDNINDLASKNALANKGLRRLAETLNKKRKAKGKKPVDIDKIKKGAAQRFAKIAQDSLESSGSSPGALMAALGYEGNRGDSDQDDKVNLDEALKESTGVSRTARQPLEGKSYDEEEFIFDFGEEESEGEIFDGKLDHYDSDIYAKAFESQKAKGSDQIVGDRDVSIFRVISVRYLKSGLPRLLNRTDENNSLDGL